MSDGAAMTSEILSDPGEAAKIHAAREEATRGDVISGADNVRALRPHRLVAYAFRMIRGDWHGEPHLLPHSKMYHAHTIVPFRPRNEANPYWGRDLLFLCGDAGEELWNESAPYAITLDFGGNEVSVRITPRVVDELFGLGDYVAE